MNLFESSFLLFLVWTFLAKPKQKFKFDIWGSLIYEQTAIIKKNKSNQVMDFTKTEKL